MSETHFRKANSVDDRELEEEVKRLTNVDVVLEETRFTSRYVNSDTAYAILIDESGGKGAVHTQIGTGKVEILPTGPDLGNGFRILILDEGRTCLILGQPSIRCFQVRRA
ncbi:hypothetical protein ZTR_10335 [Talaromyces verruculosus]|nr:hypothetical protein ZTR_10335 [Talaromyces verruculosus]